MARKDAHGGSLALEYVAGSGSLGGRLQKPIVTIGNFDGLHVGHRAITDIVVARARANGGTAVVYTFNPHPIRVLRPDQALRLLTTPEQKVELLEQAGIDVLIVEDFDEKFAAITAEEFIREILFTRIQPLEVYVGYDFHFGRDREGSMRFLTELGPKLGFSVTIIPEVTMGGSDVNSTRIRKLLVESRVEEVGQMLGRAYSVRGRIVEGDRRGRTMGFPTANLDPENEILPAAGVYAGRVLFIDEGSPERGVELPAVMNVGTRPTFEGDGRMRAEAHLIDFEGDVYGRHVEMSFLSRLREERRFSGVEALGEQIASDVGAAREILRLP
jgi:riboflavin kinase/FMN adenylyltransferase